MVREVSDVVAEMQSSGSMYFLKVLRPSAISTRNTDQPAKLVLPRQFVQDHGDKIAKWVILRARTSSGKASDRPWPVRVKAVVRSYEVARVEFAYGWDDFAAGNRLEEGDSLVFHLKDGIRSEFEVHMFRGTGGSPYFPDVGQDSSDDDEEDEPAADSEQEEDEEGGPVTDPEEDEDGPDSGPDNNVNQSRRGRHQDEHSQFPGFRKRLTSSHLHRPDRSHRVYSGQFDFPLSFVQAHGDNMQPRVRLQGV